jgi:hypothetical protein
MKAIGFAVRPAAAKAGRIRPALRWMKAYGATGIETPGDWRAAGRLMSSVVQCRHFAKT